MGWRGFLYYYERQRIAVIVILFLIFAALLVNAVVAHRGQTEVVLAYNDSLIAEFEAFRQGLRVEDSVARQVSRNQRYSSGGNYVYNQSTLSGEESQRAAVDAQQRYLAPSFIRNY